VKNDPTRLLGTIYNNFGIEVDHFIQIDFCAFKTIVDGLGGVAVPFEYPARDKNTGLERARRTGQCFTFDGDHALAYVRSRHYQYQDENGKWKEDPVSDLGRVSRQQDFLRRVLSAALDKGVTDPDVARSLIKAAQENVVVDSGLTINKMLEFVGVLRNFDPGSIATYQIEAKGANVGGNSVLLPKINGDNMQAILAIFKGEASLAAAPEQVFETTTTSASTTTVSGPTTTARGSTTTTSTTTTTVVEGPPVTDPAENTKGIVPPRDVTC
jgi:LCP family protein required for cell wall assembly